MKYPLRRLLRVRSLLADVSRLELEARLHELAQVEGAIANMGNTRRRMGRINSAVTSGVLSKEWNETRVVGEWMTLERNILEEVRDHKMVEVDTVKTVYLEQRKECRQIESVIEARVAASATEHSRKEQRQLDDWFGQRRRSNRHL